MEEASTSHQCLETNQENNETERTNGRKVIVNGETATVTTDETEMGNGDNVEERIQEPKVGMFFNSVDDVFDYYKNYGKQLGFPVKKRSSNRDDDGELKYVTLACGRSGKSSITSTAMKPNPCIKTNCKALLSLCICSDGRWRVSSIKLEHNHELTPDSAHYFRCNRVGKSQLKRKLDANGGSGVKLDNGTSSSVGEAGGHENSLCTENGYERVSQLQLGEGDTNSILNYLMKMQYHNRNFFYAVDFDKSGRLRNVFWADARSRAAYEEFGDVIRFDTTYLANKYAIPFTPFVGVNHHGQSILLGCGLVSSEDTETFIWLFQSWLSCMSGRVPNGIITDQDKALDKAIEIVFPKAKHCWCLWHIMKKSPEKFKLYNRYESARSSFQSTVCDSFSLGEFEERWVKMIEEYKLHNNDWLSELYNERNRWVPAFVKENFWAGILPIQRCDSMKSFFDDHLKAKTTLKQFVKQYENALRSHVEKENHEDKCLTSHVSCVTHYDMEKQVHDLYTVSNFEEFQSELTGKMYCDLASVKVDAASSNYTISEDIMIGERKQCANFKVQFREHDVEVKCSCCMYEFRGILCRHAIYILIRHKIHLLPEKYIMRRWRKDVKRFYTGVKIRYNDWDATPESHRCDKMQKTFDSIKELANDSEDKCKIVIAWMDKLQHELTTLSSSRDGQPTQELPISRRLLDDGSSISKESRNRLTSNHPCGGFGIGNVAQAFISGNHYQVHDQAWNGGYGVYGMPSSSLQGEHNLKPS